ncbi:hypothetical protein [Halogranum rubrum]|uniref:hypothetical protein n=1 Tax=Halogranum rubrum TaxID=553466 RepID=UPI000B7E87A0|nr:hypothetical protein [Halogranum rubrum]
MNLESTIPTYLLFVASVILVGLATYSWQYRHEPAAKWFSVRRHRRERRRRHPGVSGVERLDISGRRRTVVHSFTRSRRHL